MSVSARWELVCKRENPKRKREVDRDERTMPSSMCCPSSFVPSFSEGRQQAFSSAKRDRKVHWNLSFSPFSLSNWVASTLLRHVFVLLLTCIRTLLFGALFRGRYTHHKGGGRPYSRSEVEETHTHTRKERREDCVCTGCLHKESHSKPLSAKESGALQAVENRIL